MKRSRSRETEKSISAKLYIEHGAIKYLRKSGSFGVDGWIIERQKAQDIKYWKIRRSKNEKSAKVQVQLSMCPEPYKTKTYNDKRSNPSKSQIANC